MSFPLKKVEQRSTFSPGTFTTGDTLIVTGIAPNCCPAGVKAGQGVWSISLLAANLSPICHIAIKSGWRNLVINSALNGWNGVWTSPTPQLQISTFSPNSPYTVQFTNLPTGLSVSSLACSFTKSSLPSLKI